jgi:hypothetical protein
MALIRVPSMLLRVTWVLALILGVSFWTGNLDNLQSVHMLLGILMVVSLFWLAIMNIRLQGNIVLTALAFVDGIALYIVGITQQNVLVTGAHWVIQIIHALLALGAIALGEIMTGQMTRLLPKTVA